MTITDEHPLRQADFTLSDDNEALRDAFATFFERECPPERVRAAEPHGFDPELWRALHDMRVVAMGVGEDRGGDGAGLLDLVLLTEQWGRHLAPVPLAETITAARAMSRCGIGADGGWLEAALDGSKLVTFAHHPARAGSPQLVQAAAVADAVVAMVGDDLVVAELTDRPDAVPNQGHTPLAWLDPAGDAMQRTVLASGPEAQKVYATARREWRLLMAGALTGMAQGALDIALVHARERIAFGVPIGSFQAVAHPLVDVSMNHEVSRRITWKAAWWADTDPSLERHLVPMAYRYAGEAAMHAATVGVHTLGGVGFTVESDQQLYFRRVKGWTLMAGDPATELDRIADELFGPAQRAASDTNDTELSA